MTRASTSKATLKFNQSLTGVPSGELLKRLNALYSELVALDQEAVETTSLDKVRDKLINPSLLLGKDRGVKAFVCCCLAELLRLYAPEAPYEEKELQDIFQFFVRQLKFFTGPSCPNYTEYAALVESLASVKSATLMATLPGADQLMTEMTQQAFKSASHDMPKHVISHLSDILIQIIDEADILPAEQVDALLCQFLPKNIRANPVSTSLAVSVCKPLAEKLQQYVAQYFTEVLANYADDDDGDEDDEEDEDMEDNEAPRASTSKATSRKTKNGKLSKGKPSRADASDFILTHDLVKAISRSCPELLTNVIPLIEEELVSEDIGVRVLATRTLGDVFSDKPLEKAGSLPLMLNAQPARADMAKKYPSTWQFWLGRSMDKAPQVRLALLECCQDVLQHHHELAHDVYIVLKDRLVDPDDKIRAAACAAFATVDYESALHAFDKNTLQSLSQRIQDRRPSVQKEALNSLGRMYNLAFPEISNGDVHAIDRFGWIPEEILKAYLIPDRDLLASTERTLHDYILPAPPRPEEETFYVDRLLLILHYLDAPGRKALLRAARLFEKRPLIYETYLDVCEKQTQARGKAEAEEEEETAVAVDITTACRILAARYPDPPKAETDLLKFAKLNDHRSIKLLKTAMNPESDSPMVLRNVEEALKRIEKAASGILETFAIMIRRSAFLLVNRSTVVHLLERVSRAADLEMKEPDTTLEEDDDKGDETQVRSFGQLSRDILETIFKNCPMLMQHHLSEMSRILTEDKRPAMLNIALRGLGCVTAAYPDAFERDRDVLDKAFSLAMHGTPLQAKYAARFLAAVPHNVEQCEDLVKDIADALPVASGSSLISRLNALKRLAKDATEAFDVRATEITVFLTSLLKRPALHSTPSKASSKASNTSMDMDVKPFSGEYFDDWCEDEDVLPEHEACLLGLKVLASRAVALAERPNATQSPAVTSVFKMLGLILTYQGRPSTFKTGPGLSGRLRLVAATSLLRLACKSEYQELFMQYFEIFAWTMQDSAFQVRSAFVHKFVVYATQRRFTNPRMNVVLFLTAHDPDVENRLIAQRFVQERLRSMRPEARLQEFDLLLVRLLHLLAHHPDFSSAVEDLQAFARYLEFFLDCVGTRENISLLYYLALKMKTVRDAYSRQYDNHLYILSELAQYVIKARAKLCSWSIQNHLGQIKMPKDIFKPLPDRETAMEINRKVYISAQDIEAIGAVGKPVDAPKKLKQVKKNIGKSTTASSSRGEKQNHARTASNGSTNVGTGTAKQTARPRAKPTASTDAANSSSRAGAKIDAASRKRKKGLKEWEDDTEDEEEDEEEEEEEEEEEDTATGPLSTSAPMSSDNTSTNAQPQKTRPSNLRQRPARTTDGVNSTSASSASVLKSGRASIANANSATVNVPASSVEEEPNTAEDSTALAPLSSSKRRTVRTGRLDPAAAAESSKENITTNGTSIKRNGLHGANGEEGGDGGGDSNGDEVVPDKTGEAWSPKRRRRSRHGAASTSPAKLSPEKSEIAGQTASPSRSSRRRRGGRAV